MSHQSQSVRRSVATIACRALLALSIATAVTVPGSPLLAQQVTAEPEPQSLLEVVVTGSRIIAPASENASSVGPVVSVGSQDFQAAGATSVEDLLNELPQVTPDQSSSANNGGLGTADINLRNLGAWRTLVLINGRRLNSGDPSEVNQASDVDFIPVQLIKRADLLTGGASSIYGADAVAGVVNFITIDDFQGVHLDANVGGYWHHNGQSAIQQVVTAAGDQLPGGTSVDGGSQNLTAIFGTNFNDNQGNVTGFLTYRNDAPVTQNERDFSACQLQPNTNAAGAFTPGFTCGGSPYANPGYITTFANGNNFWAAPPGGVLTPCNQSTVPCGPLYNYGPSNYFQRPDDRYNAGLLAHLNLNDHVRVYSEFMFMRDTTQADLAPTGTFTGPFNVNCNNPLLSPSEVAGLCTALGLGPGDLTSIDFGHRFVENGPREFNWTHTDFREVLGVKGSIVDGWNYDVYAQYGEALYNLAWGNDVSAAKLQNSLLVDPATGACYATEAPADDPYYNGFANAAGCVPYNLFGTGAPSPAAIAYLATPGYITGWTREQIASGSVTGDLGRYGLKLPTASDGINIALGAEYRYEALAYLPDEEFQTGDLIGFGPAAPTQGDYHVAEGFGELLVPLVQNVPFAKSIAFHGSYRYSSYSLGYDTNTYGLGFDWAPVSDIRLRYSYNRAVRAPNIQELFSPAVVGVDPTIGTDPCTGAAPEFTLAQCENTGVTAAQYGHITANPDAQYNGATGGNSSLRPEIADTRSFGIVLTPRIVPGLTASIDYYNIYITGAIGEVGALNILDQCALTGAATFCSLVHRNSVGSLWDTYSGYVSDTLINTGSLQTDGIDLDIKYDTRLPAGFGQLQVSFAGSYLHEYIAVPYPGAAKFDCAGLYGPTCGTAAGVDNAGEPLPKFRSRMATTWATPWMGFTTTLTWRHIERTTQEGTSSYPALAVELPTVGPEAISLGGREYFDLSAAFKPLPRLTVRGGINNIFDRDPPIVDSSNGVDSVSYSGNTFPQVYDTLGRFLFLDVTADF